MVFFARPCGYNVAYDKIYKMPKKQNKHHKTQKITKKREQYLRRVLRLWSTIMTCTAFLLFFFNFCLSITGSWDDLNAPAILVAVVICLVALAVSGVNVIKYRAQNYELIAPLALLGLSAIFYFAVTIIGASSIMAGI